MKNSLIILFLIFCKYSVSGTTTLTAIFSSKTFVSDTLPKLSFLKKEPKFFLGLDAMRESTDNELVSHLARIEYRPFDHWSISVAAGPFYRLAQFKQLSNNVWGQDVRANLKLLPVTHKYLDIFFSLEYGIRKGSATGSVYLWDEAGFSRLGNANIQLTQKLIKPAIGIRIKTPWLFYTDFVLANVWYEYRIDAPPNLFNLSQVSLCCRDRISNTINNTINKTISGSNLAPTITVGIGFWTIGF